ncbi:hypothetical protein HX065_15185 [Myroides odoratimimus]|uniref:hypothetical protein n=2 Tax=Myroides TaxID=76831 RepID=UPI0025768A11|nr:hypothetical protein [Myroides odoratimimus]MDM1035985.1 hypothetical protein [Myroides odoratimimus]MDM1461366.1 hypothetical protein [Myroides odoratimimus]
MLKTLLIIGFCFLSLTLAVNNLSLIMGGMRKKKANRLIQEYLEHEFKGQLKAVEIRRFFNASNMNPNMFSVIIYDHQLAQVRWVLFFDAKILKNENRIEQGVSYAKPVKEQYQDALADYYTKEDIKLKMIDLDCRIDISYDSLTMTYLFNPNPNELKTKTKKLLYLLNQQKDALKINSIFTITIHLPTYNEDIFMIVIHSIEDSWQVKECLLKQETNYFKTLQEKLLPKRMDYLAGLDHLYSSHDFSLLYVDTACFTKAVWVHLLIDTKEVEQEKNSYHKTPVTAALLETINLTNKVVTHREIVPITEPNSFISILEEIKPLLAIKYTF